MTLLMRLCTLVVHVLCLPLHLIDAVGLYKLYKHVIPGYMYQISIAYNKKMHDKKKELFRSLADFKPPGRTADAPGDRLRHRDQLPVLPEWLQGGLHRPQPELPEVPDQSHGGQRPPHLRPVRGGVRGGHGSRAGQLRGRGRVHAGALLRGQRGANSARGSPHPETRRCLLLHGACGCRPLHLVLLLPARSPASLVLLRRWLPGHPGNLEKPGVGRILRAPAEAHRGSAHVHDQASHRGLRCEIASVRCPRPEASAAFDLLSYVIRPC
ncbi:unnamed protein product [Tetraodon nigroviridis]|uniref:Chromosome 11 SCAF14979, whole genome shotgun sequence n=1 Tax=Tetraodon nigroviridis TaxID=99883 RepID=Q4RXZ2_TETNG|nr:unnamed protein product [Tetraodon nigroviridis]